MQRWQAAPVAGVDSCGAGDTFHGAYAWALAAGLPPAERFQIAAWSAGLKVTQLGNAAIPNLPYEQPDGTPLRVDTDYFGKVRNEANPTPGPFENPGQGKLKVW